MIHECRFEAAASSVGRARCFVVDAAGVDESTSQVLQLVVSELATNAVLHARSPYDVRVITGLDALRIEVADESPQLPSLRNGGSRSVSGRGLAIVDRLVRQWGVVPEAPGKRIWVEFGADSALRR